MAILLEQIRILSQDQSLANQIVVGPTAANREPHRTDSELIDAIQFAQDNPSDFVEGIIVKVLASMPTDVLQANDEHLVEGMLITAEQNRSTAQEFATRSRELLPRIFPGLTEDFGDLSGEVDLGAPQITRLLQRWNISALCYKLPSFPHWTLILRAPEQKQDGSWHVLTYDPMRNGAHFEPLPNWHAYDGVEELADMPWVVTGEICGPESAFQALVDGAYDLSFAHDGLLLQNPELLRAKTGDVQIDAYNCGPLAVFAAAIRSGMKPGSSVFKEFGITQMEEDIELKIRAREEFIHPIVPIDPDSIRQL